LSRITATHPEDFEVFRDDWRLEHDMAEPLQYRLLPDDAAGWGWEVVTKDRKLVARGVADSHVEARGAAMEAGLQGFIKRKRE
jgi:hypothetical protein